MRGRRVNFSSTLAAWQLSSGTSWDVKDHSQSLQSATVCQWTVWSYTTHCYKALIKPSSPLSSIRSPCGAIGESRTLKQINEVKGRLSLMTVYSTQRLIMWSYCSESADKNKSHCQCLASERPSRSGSVLTDVLKPQGILLSILFLAKQPTLTTHQLCQCQIQLAI